METSPVIKVSVFLLLFFILAFSGCLNSQKKVDQAVGKTDSAVIAKPGQPKEPGGAMPAELFKGELAHPMSAREHPDT